LNFQTLCGAQDYSFKVISLDQVTAGGNNNYYYTYNLT